MSAVDAGSAAAGITDSSGPTAAAGPANAITRPFSTDVSRPSRLETGRLGHLPPGFSRAQVQSSRNRNSSSTDQGRPGTSVAAGQSSSSGPTDAAGPGSASAAYGQEHLDALAESANKTIDDEIATLLDAFRGIVELATVADKDEFRIAQDGLQMQSKADAMVRATHNLLLLSKALSLSLLLSKSPSSQAMRRQAQTLIAESQEHKQRSAELVQHILHHQASPTS
ncbi:hypothetical protein K437DRAFT_97650 [Tilletiaria anomala UBC 951]|uniref:Uncharacterized protein n=1 Tax=Tilletiaria anomala (strain ATCC 24038 / CBS 436.72 / UBC 951) TaxID=1037660 RepID=A0A066WRK7_TILAU|nr:uncharacterized protein K437DRAFT_97650 [Tilletiaria anomala UBC 951]KDN53295.1 hypothetical protein K437DRAFT_97650 [Tilletiaria anomala UBC 951]